MRGRNELFFRPLSWFALSNPIEVFSNEVSSWRRCSQATKARYSRARTRTPEMPSSPPPRTTLAESGGDSTGGCRPSSQQTSGELGTITWLIQSLTECQHCLLELAKPNHDFSPLQLMILLGTIDSIELHFSTAGYLFALFNHTPSFDCRIAWGVIRKSSKNNTTFFKVSYFEENYGSL